MTFNFKPSSRLNGLVFAGLLITFGASAMAQSAAPAAPGAAASSPNGENKSQHMDQHMSQHRGHHDPAKMQAMMAKHQADLKDRLQLTPAQEGAWTAYTAAMQRPAGMGMRLSDAQRAEMSQLSTPERIDKMRAIRTERMAQMTAEMDKRANAVKTFYAALTPEQQKVFDAAHQRRGAKGEHRGHGGPEPKKS
jgi:Spy/CpxP family protein refolding chaperone